MLRGLPEKSNYRGRFAPSPTGALHFGSLVAAVASYADARAHSGEWLVRMEDVDTPRTQPGADALILRTLEQFGFEWDGQVEYQSRRTELYAHALERLRKTGAAYPCSCSRREAGGGVYPGTCRAGVADASKPVAWRVRVVDAPVACEDRVYGVGIQHLGREVGDFVVRRSDGLFAYQLAVVVDDAEQDITDVVRGADLLDSTPRQFWLQRLLGCPRPRYMHVPVATDAAGEKLSKQTRAPALDAGRAADELRAALRFLEQAPVDGDVPRDILRQAAAGWNPGALIGRTSGARAREQQPE